VVVITTTTLPFGTIPTTQHLMDTEIDFTIPYSLQRYLVEKNSDFSTMMVIDMTSEFKKQYYNVGNKEPSSEGSMGTVMETGAVSSASMGSGTPYSGGTFGGSLGSSFNDK
jgi:hypothetical protein